MEQFKNLKPLGPLKNLKLPTPTQPVANAQPIPTQPVPTQPIPAQPIPESDISNEQAYEALFGDTTSDTSEENIEKIEKSSIDVANRLTDVIEDDIIGESTSSNKKSSSKKKTSESDKEKEFKGIRKIKVYGQTLFEEPDYTVTLEQIRQRLISEYGYEEFKGFNTVMRLDTKTGVVIPEIPFQKKG